MVSELNTPEFRMPEGSLDGCWLVNRNLVNMQDLYSADRRPGRVVRVESIDAIRYVPGVLDDYSRVAGLISDAA